jgi:transposase-like protein
MLSCPSCGSHNVRRSLRKGIREGLLLRITLRAPYRCFNCGTRFQASSTAQGYGKRKPHKSLLGFLGFRRNQAEVAKKKMLMFAVGIAVLLIAIWLVFRMMESMYAPSPAP